MLFLDLLFDEVLGQVSQPEDLVECGASWAQNKSKLILSSIGYLSETITLTRFLELSGQRHFPTDITLGAVSFSISCWALNDGADVKIQASAIAAVSRSVHGVRSCYVLRYLVFGSNSCSGPASRLQPGLDGIE